MVVKIVEPLKARLVDLFWQGSTYFAVLDFRSKEVEGRQHEDDSEDHEDPRWQCQPLARHVLHREVELQVHWNVGEEEEEKDRREVSFSDEQEIAAEQSVDAHEDDEKPEPERLSTKFAIAGQHVL